MPGRTTGGCVRRGDPQGKNRQDQPQQNLRKLITVLLCPCLVGALVKSRLYSVTYSWSAMDHVLCVTRELERRGLPGHMLLPTPEVKGNMKNNP